MSAFNKFSSPRRALRAAGLAAAFVAPLTCALTVGGCGGSGGGGGGGSAPAASSSEPHRATGNVQLSIKWPAREEATRYIPTYAVSLRFTLQSARDPNLRYTLVVPRPADVSQVQTVTFPERIHTGAYRLTGAASTRADGDGTPVSVAAQDIQVNQNETTSAQLTLATTIARLEILNQPLVVRAGQTSLLFARAVGGDGESTVFVPSGASGLRFALVSGADTTQASLSDTGVLTANRAGTVRVRVSEPGIGLTAEADVTVEAGPATGQTNGGLMPNCFAKRFGDTGNTSYTAVPASVPEGLAQWQIANGATILCVGPDSVGYGTRRDGTRSLIESISPSGAVRWSVEVPQNVAGLALSADGTLYVSGDEGTGTNRVTRLTALVSADGTTRFTKPLPISRVSAANIRPNGFLYFAGFSTEGKGDICMAVDGITGEVRWQTVVVANVFTDHCPALSPDGATVYVGGINLLQALDAQTGERRWRYNVRPGSGSETLNYSVSVGKDNTVYATASPLLVAVNGAAGTLKWRRQFSVTLRDTPVVSPDGATVYVRDGRENELSTVYAINAATGEDIWQNTRFGRGEFFIPSRQLVLGGGVLYTLGGLNGNTVGLTLLDAQTGAFLYTFISNAAASNQPSQFEYPISLPVPAPSGLLYSTATKGSVSTLLGIR